MSLIVYKASAGSGKTYTLTRDFILLSLRGFEGFTWRRVLAVTFTNKAASEMKERVLAKLKELAADDDRELIRWYSAELGWSEDDVKKKAGIVLSQILHDYGNFSVLTIDSFLQRIFRAFLFELDVNYSYDLMLDGSRMIEETARSFLFEIQKDSHAFAEVVRFLEYAMISEDKYNIQNDVTNLGQELTREELYRYLPALMKYMEDPGKIRELLSRIGAEVASYTGQMETLAGQCSKRCIHHKLSQDDFAGKSRGVYPWIMKLHSDGFDFTLNSAVESGFAKGIYHQPKSPSASVIAKEIAPLLNQMVALFHQHNARMLGLHFVYRGLHVLTLLKYLEEKRKELLLGNGFFYLGDVPRVLKSVLSEGGVGMVYEKTGNRYDHIFMDEFQDTSQLQWDNFRPLVQNSLAQNLPCIIVGDVKQAIYRWRNGDWKILATGVRDEFAEQIREENLDTNRRSLPEVIAFNNLFFGKAVQGLSARDVPADIPALKDIYEGFEQKTWKSGDGQGGYVEINAIPYSAKEEYTNAVSVLVPELIAGLWARGCRDIAVLVRSNREITSVLEALISTSPAYPVMTEKSFRLETHPAIRFITAMLYAIAFPDDKSHATAACWWYHSAIAGESEDLFSFHDDTGTEAYFESRGFAVKDLFSQKDPYTLACAVAEVFGISRCEEWQPFLSAFLDAVFQFQSVNGGTLRDFLKWYDSHKEELQVQLGNIRNAVKIMTIHKSKGLQFSTVVIPFGGWRFVVGKQPPLWLHSDDPVLSDIPAVYVPCKKETAQTLFAEAYHQENYKTMIDNLNLMYVAFTRAEAQMYVFYPEKVRKKTENEKNGGEEKEPEMKNVSSTEDLMKQVCAKLEVPFEKTESGKRIAFGKPFLYKEEGTDEKGRGVILNGCHAHSPELVIRTDRRQLIVSEKDEQVRHGILLHSVLEQMKTEADLDVVMNDFLRRGDMSEKEADALRVSFRTLMKNPEFASWFNGSMKVYAEHTLLSTGAFHRPDRIMINGKNAVVADYKTGKTPPEKYAPQIRRYMNLLLSCGFENVRGYIVQLDTAEIREISLLN